MSLRPTVSGDVPASTATVARVAFPHGNPYLILRNRLGTVFTDAQFVPLFAPCGQPAACPGRLALVTLLQFAENLSDQRATDAIRGRIDGKDLLGLKLIDPGFDVSRPVGQQDLLLLAVGLKRADGVAIFDHLRG